MSPLFFFWGGGEGLEHIQLSLSQEAFPGSLTLSPIACSRLPVFPDLDPWSTGHPLPLLNMIAFWLIYCPFLPTKEKVFRPCLPCVLTALQSPE